MLSNIKNYKPGFEGNYDSLQEGLPNGILHNGAESS